MAASAAASSLLSFSTVAPSAGVTIPFTALIPPSGEKDAQPVSIVATNTPHKTVSIRNARGSARCLAMINLMQLSEEAPQLRTHFDSGQSKRSWRTIRPANGDTMCDVSQVHDKPRSRDNCGRQLDHWRMNAGKECVQRAAAVHLTIAVVANCVAIVTMQVCVMIVDARSSRLGEGFGAGERRCHNPRELGDHEERDQYTNEVLYCAKPGHQRATGLCQQFVSIRFSRQSPRSPVCGPFQQVPGN